MGRSSSLDRRQPPFGDYDDPVPLLRPVRVFRWMLPVAPYSGRCPADWGAFCPGWATTISGTGNRTFMTSSTSTSTW